MSSFSYRQSFSSETRYLPEKSLLVQNAWVGGGLAILSCSKEEGPDLELSLLGQVALGLRLLCSPGCQSILFGIV
jgi:hypothetical protein